MKILQVINNMSVGGAQKFVLDYIPELLNRNHVVDIILLENIDSPFFKILEKYNVKLYKLYSNTVYNPLLIFKILKLLNNYDIVHVHLFPSLYWVGLAKIFIKKAPVFIYTEHNTENRRRFFFFFRCVVKFVYRQFDKIVTVSDEATVQLVKYLGTEFKMECIYNGINIKTYLSALSSDKRSMFNLDSATVLLLMVAGFRKAKDQNTIIYAMNKLPDNYHLILVGDGERRKISESLIASLNLSQRVHMLGVRNDIPQILKTVDIVIMSSYYEGLSLSSIEGMCVGKPFVASDVHGLHEIVFGAGVLFPRGDSDKLAEEVLKLTSNSKYYNEVAAKCFARAKCFDLGKTVDLYENVYYSLLNRG